ncbi:DegT/DnrJ/EryC1/StrS family aminotransferase [Thiohalocapsa marina]|uniref:DegT/DnrJ/EryC1/StrS family aminotransferase n=2 Tax=Thiohalocapsa marina TaxID=424902 RepID=A0A5M8FUL2_9GAMM|nr:DegT/DnrJ/EryC1/StrS family aminotransferase [Thiohalocapsa marina]
MDALFDRVEVLSAPGFEQPELYRRAAVFAQAQIAAAARALQGQPACIVTNDPAFDALGELACRSPAQALVWLQQGPQEDEAAPAAPLPFIDLAAQQAGLRPAIERGIETVLRHGQYVLGPEVQELEARLAAYTGAGHCVTVGSGTEALLISLMALGIGPGDEVITTAFTFVATAEVIVLTGARPVFVDIEPDTCNIDADKIEAAITPRTRAIMPVSLYGQPADMERINAIAARHGLPVIEDAAQSFGADYQGRRSCNLSTIGCTSFFPAKPLGGYGDGGAIFTSDADLARAMRQIRVHGQGARYVHERIGICGRMDTLQCAVLLAKLDRFDWEVQRRHALGARYSTLFADLPGVATPVIRPDRSSVFAQYTLQVEARDAVTAAIGKAGVPTAVHYPIPLNAQPAYRDLGNPEATPVAAAVAARVFSLPMHPDLTDAAQARIAAAVRDAVIGLTA